MCLDRRIGDRRTLERELAAWVKQRNASKARVRWLFDVAQARQKPGRAYPKPLDLLSSPRPENNSE